MMAIATELHLQKQNISFGSQTPTLHKPEHELMLKGETSRPLGSAGARTMTRIQNAPFINAEARVLADTGLELMPTQTKLARTRHKPWIRMYKTHSQVTNFQAQLGAYTFWGHQKAPLGIDPMAMYAELGPTSHQLSSPILSSKPSSNTRRLLGIHQHPGMG